MDQQNSVPRVKPSDIEAAIRSEHYFTALQGARMAVIDHVTDTATMPEVDPHDPELGLVTICVLILKNGFKVVGTSVCAHPDMFSASIGRQYAREEAIVALYPILGYALKQKLHEEATAKAIPQQLELFGAIGDEL